MGKGMASPYRILFVLSMYSSYLQGNVRADCPITSCVNCNAVTGRCFACADNFGIVSSTGRCAQCPQGCTQCIDNSQGSLICAGCSQGNGLIEVNGVRYCTGCHANCLTCDYYFSGGCTRCAAGFLRNSLSPADCKSCAVCPTGSWQSTACDNVIQDTQCVACESGSMVSGKSCVQCTTGKYVSADRLSCLPCSVCSGTQYLQNGNECKIYRDTICTECGANKASTRENMASCDTCTSGYYTMGSPFSCFRCDSNPCSVGFYQECSNAQRTCTQCAGLTLATACPVGQGPEPKTCPLGTTSETKSVCTACAAGSERLTAGAPLDCAKCGAGFYKDVRGVSSCGRCTNAPANNSLYMIWGNTEATIASCPWYFSFFFWFWCGVAWM